MACISFEPVRASFPSAERATLVTFSEWPRNVIKEGVLVEADGIRDMTLPSVRPMSIDPELETATLCLVEGNDHQPKDEPFNMLQSATESLLKEAAKS